MTSFKEQFETLKANLPKVQTITISDFLRNNFNEVQEIIKLSKNPTIKETFYGKSAYSQISYMAFQAGITQKNGKAISKSSISTYLTRLYKEKGKTKKSGSNVKSPKTKIFTSLIFYIQQLKEYESMSDEDKVRFDHRAQLVVDRFHKEVLNIGQFSVLCDKATNTNNRIDKRYKVSILDLALLLHHLKDDMFLNVANMNNLKKKALSK